MTEPNALIWSRRTLRICRLVLPVAGKTRAWRRPWEVTNSLCFQGQQFFHRLGREERNLDDATFQELPSGSIQACAFSEGGQMLLQLTRDRMPHDYSPSVDFYIRRKENRP